MNSTMWTYFFMMVGILGIVLINIFSNMLITNEQNYMALKEAAEGALVDSVDLQSFREGIDRNEGVTIDTDPESMHCATGIPGTIRINKEKFVESFVRRFAKTANLAKKYKIVIHDIDECPPKVSLSVYSEQELQFIDIFRVDYSSDSVDVVNRISGILETKREKVAE